MKYTGGGSGEGRKRIAWPHENRSAFAGSDAVPSKAEWNATSDMVMVPSVVVTHARVSNFKYTSKPLTLQKLVYIAGCYCSDL